eukprot:CAMPEP_0114981442 /NCGR_PEP_ID=MMETSP0216-20121206/5545_1 /TAXON_ID=223996 /ORGANISM="Protocruzia adherens, Strain Boccale" /LENGTH=312 /DNA_ID=CAMNT_0002343111 /DNA_START=140 /DNA_END=1078 /DNA_ORIENTATION=+
MIRKYHYFIAVWMILLVSATALSLENSSTENYNPTESKSKRREAAIQSSLGLQLGKPTIIQPPTPKHSPKPGFGEQVRQGVQSMSKFLSQMIAEIQHMLDNSPSDALFLVIGLLTFIAVVVMWKLLLNAYFSKNDKKQDFFEGVLRPSQPDTPADNRVYIGGRRLWRAKATKLDEFDTAGVISDDEADKINRKEPCFRFNRKFFLASEINRFYMKMKEADSLSLPKESDVDDFYYGDDDEESECLLKGEREEFLSDETTRESCGVSYSETTLSTESRGNDSSRRSVTKKYYQATMLPKCIGEYKSVYLPDEA